MFELVSKYQPSGDQPKAIKELVDGLNEGKKEQVLRFFVDFCAKTRANGFSADTFLLLHRQYTPPLFFIHIFARILHKLCIQYTYT